MVAVALVKVALPVIFKLPMIVDEELEINPWDVSRPVFEIVVEALPPTESVLEVKRKE